MRAGLAQPAGQLQREHAAHPSPVPAHLLAAAVPRHSPRHQVAGQVAAVAVCEGRAGSSGWRLRQVGRQDGFRCHVFGCSSPGLATEQSYFMAVRRRHGGRGSGEIKACPHTHTL